MSYTPTIWASDTEITTALLNHAEIQYDEWYTYYGAHVHTDDYYTKTQSDAAFWGTHNDGPGSGSDADLIYYAGGNLHASTLQNLGVPLGIIILWYSSVGSIPSGWALCNGSSGTPDLRGKFIPCAGGSYSVGATGGISTFNVSGSLSIGNTALGESQIPAHTHSVEDNYNDWFNKNHPGTARLTWAVQSRDTGSTGGSQGHTHTASLSEDVVPCLPQYHALCYIKRIS